MNGLILKSIERELLYKIYTTFIINTFAMAKS